MTEYDFWKMAFDNQWATVEDLTEAQTYGIITEEEVQEIIKPSISVEE